MIRLAICDDDMSTLENTSQLVSKFADANPHLGLNVHKFNSGYDLVESIESGDRNFQLYLLNLTMPLINSLDVGQRIRKMDDQAIIIFMASSTDELEATSVSPFQYLLKPIETKALFPVLERACAKISHHQDTNIMVKVKGGIAYVRHPQITYIEYMNHTLIYHLATGKTLTTMFIRESFSSYAKKYLHDSRFIKPHASFMVNMDYVQLMTTKGFEMVSGELIPISKRAYAKVRKRFVEYMVSRQDLAVN